MPGPSIKPRQNFRALCHFWCTRNGPSTRHAWNRLEVDLLEAPQAPATPLSRSSCLAPQPARPPASPKVTMTQFPGSVPFSVKEIGDGPLRKSPHHNARTYPVPSSIIGWLSQGHRCLSSGDATPMMLQPTVTENGTGPNFRYVCGSLSRPYRLIVTPQKRRRCLFHIGRLILPLYGP